MCGVVAVTGSEPALPILLDGLSRLEYRGYDSAGVVLQDDAVLWRRRRRGRLAELAGALGDAPGAATAGLGHTRWATHGEPAERNAHPHVDCGGRIAVTHNGIVENHKELRAKLEAGGHLLTSETDTEVLPHLIEDFMASGAGLAGAVRSALACVEGSFAIAVLFSGEPGLIVAARRGSPLIAGRTDAAGFVASDIPALLPYTREVYAIEEDHLVELRPGSIRITAPDGREVLPDRRGIGWDVKAADRGEFPDFMLKEIHEQPRAVAATLGGRRRADGPLSAGNGLPELQLAAVRRVIVVGCGTSLHAGMAARPALESWARVPVDCEVSSEFRYRDLVVERGALVVGVSQSGETIDTLYALRESRRLGAGVLAVTNVADSAIAREAGSVLCTRAGPEIGVAATKTHVAQVAALQSLALALAAARRTLPPQRIDHLAGALADLPARIGAVLERADGYCAVARRFAGVRDFFFLGRGAGHAVALEGALKLKEIAYVRAEACAAGEMKHGPIALVEPGVVVVGVAGTGLLRDKMLSNIAEMQARGATIVLVAADGDREAAEAADALLPVPDAPSGTEHLSPAVDVVPLQLFAYALAKARGCDVDKPRNLAKTVTVE